ncbi:rhamnan synthesis F family protein [Shewanella aestuarii]|uniref:Glycosyltransferase n=1 Tax=Shewanella aestuarii TaxID=1028752 RepID=A0A6G9QKN8_9GAMM|nr:rhamnan synthesis F family protein [Shewanella aestuarii]QIR15130.1 glycosyltransferase [Shewanella aestuarii]
MLKVWLNPKLRKELREIKKLGIDWTDFYKFNNIDSKLEPEVYFVLNVRKLPLVINGVFDVSFYLNQYKDVRNSKVNPLLHYFKCGIDENRLPFSVPTQMDEKAEMSLVEELSDGAEVINDEIDYDFCLLKDSGINFEDYIKNNGLTSRDEAIAHYVRYWRKYKPVIEGVFDTGFYLSENLDVRKSNKNPLVHYILHGKKEGRTGLRIKKISKDIGNNLTKAHDKNAEFSELLKKEEIDWSLYNIENHLANTNDEPIAHYLKNENIMPLKIPGFFDSSLYLELYPDIKKAKISPLRHYVMHGKAEGRMAYFKADKYFKKGKVEFDKAKPTYIIANHESSSTGAPLVGFNLGCEILSECNLINFILNKKQLHEAFEKNCVASMSGFGFVGATLVKKAIEHISNHFGVIDGIVCNSVETVNVLEAANDMGIPSVALVHEFAEYSKPVGKISNTVLFADRVVVPAQVLKESMLKEFSSRVVKATPNNILIQPQGALPFIPEGHGNIDSVEQLKNIINLNGDEHLLIGAGYVQVRKGVDLFISAAKRIKELTSKPCKFVWVGEGYNPDTDLNYSNWIQTQISLQGLEDDIVFLGHQRNLDNILKLTDVFCMTSRLDPFPNVVIDALKADVHIACFDKSTGCAEFLKHNNANATISPYLDIEAFSQDVSKYLNNINCLKGRNVTISKEKLCFYDYKEFILNQLQEAKKFQSKVVEQIEKLKATGAFQPKFYNPYVKVERAINEYVTRACKGIHQYNPAPGFNENTWVNESNELQSAPLLEAFKRGDTITHMVVNLDKGDVASVVDFVYAVHIHLYYTDLVDEFAKYLSNLPGHFDVFITHINKCDEASIKLALKNCGCRKLSLFQVPNLGRDIAPFIKLLKENILSSHYKVVGHFHSKKSSAVNGDMGERWRMFLLNTLIGKKEHALKTLSQFNNENVGLVFAEDRHCVDNGANTNFIEDLLIALNVSESPYCFNYPLGTMFWAKTDSLEPLTRLEERFYKIPEPVPYDGSYLHAIERVLPKILSVNNTKFVTVFTEAANW